MFYSGRGGGAARTIVSIPDRLIRKKIQTNSGEPGTVANNVVSSSRKGPDGGSLPEYVPHIRVPLPSSSAFSRHLSYSVIKWCQGRIVFKQIQMRCDDECSCFDRSSIKLCNERLTSAMISVPVWDKNDEIAETWRC